MDAVAHLALIAVLALPLFRELIEMAQLADHDGWTYGF